MAQKTEQVQAVKIVSNPADKYATIARACLAAASAAEKLSQTDKRNEFLELKRWANAMYDLYLTQGNPSLG